MLLTNPDVRMLPLLVVAAFLVAGAAWASPDEPLRAMAGRSFYTSEKQGEIILLGAESLLARTDLRADVLLGERLLAQRAPLARGRRVTVAFDLAALPEGDSELVCVLSGEGEGSWIPVGPFAQEDLDIHPRNQILNPSFEDNPSSGTPEGCYASTGAGRGATYFVDSRVARHGRHSVRLTAPDANNSVELGTYAPEVTAGRTYRLSVWAKAPDIPSLAGTADDDEGPALKLSMQGLGERVFKPTREWQEYILEGPIRDDIGRAEIGLALQTAGTAWVDLLQLVDISSE
jgi:hypothetical protein